MAAKRRYDFGGPEIIDAPGSGQLVAVKKPRNDVEIYNDQQKSLLSVVSLFSFKVSFSV